MTLLFDYYDGEIPAIRQEVPLVILSSHRHADHFNPEILRVGSEAGTTLVLSSDIAGEPALTGNCPGNVRFMEADERLELPGLRLATFDSTDEGVAFLIHLTGENRLIYHCGDLNWWVWDEDTPEEYDAMTAKFFGEVEKLGQSMREMGFDAIDAAFLTLDPRQEQYEFYGIDYYQKQVPMKHIFPMHCWDHYEINGRYGERCPNLVVIRERGDHYEI